MYKSKVAILTLPLHTNFGGNLQAYALSKTLQNLGFDVEIINLVSDRYNNKSYYIKLLKKLIKQYVFFKDMPVLLTPKEYLSIGKNHIDFIKYHMKLTSPIYDKNNITSIFRSNNYSAVIVGSDQVWRKAYTPNIYTFFLDFIKDKKIKKIAYAASFGLDEWQYDKNETDKLRVLAKDFNYISVREDSALKLCQDYLGVNPDHVLDPTLLLSKKDYLNLCKDIKSENKGKVFNYILDTTPEKTKIVNKIASKLNKEVFGITLNKNKETRLVDNNDSYIIPPVEQWLKSFDDADFVITDSFHGMVFSIIFNKPFYVLVNEKRGASRFYSLLKQLNLEDRILNKDNFLDFKEINFSIINGKINHQVKDIKGLLKVLLG